MITLLNIIYYTTATLALIAVAGLFVLTVLLFIADWRYEVANTNTKRSGERIVRGAVAHSMGKP